MEDNLNLKPDDFQKACEEKFKDFKPETQLLIEDGSWRTIVCGKLGVSGRKFKMVEMLEGQQFHDDGNLKDELLLVSEVLLEIERDPKEAKHKDEPVIDFQKKPPQSRENFLKGLGQREYRPLKTMLEYLIYISTKDEFFRTK